MYNNEIFVIIQFVLLHIFILRKRNNHEIARHTGLETLI